MPSRRRGRLGGGALVAALAILMAACGQTAPETTASTPVATPTGATAGATPSATPSPTPEPALAWGPTVAQWDEALADAAELADAEAAALVIMPDFGGTDPEALKTLMAAGFGGVMLRGQATGTEERIRILTSAVRKTVAGDWGGIVAVDQEGGTVDRLSDVLPSLPSFMAAGAAQDPDRVAESFGAMGLRMVDLGFTMDFAPVADVTIGPQDPVIGSRSASDDPHRAAEAVVAASRGLLAAGVVPVVKHFPGHGSVTTDSHVGLPVQQATVAELEARDLIPFAEAIAAGAPVVMTGHIVVEEWSDQPATLAPEAYAYLRQDMGFDGLVVTDGLNMAAVTEGRTAGEVAVAALAAGADLLLIPTDPYAAKQGLVDAIADGSLPRERLTEAAARVILLGRWQQELAAAPSAEPDPSTYGQLMAAAGLTLATADCGAAPVTGSAYITGGNPWEREVLADLLATAGVEIGSGTHIHLSRGFSGASDADVVVAVDAPWWLETVDADAYVGLYGRSFGSYTALADMLVGFADAPGTWPVGIDLPYEACAASR